MSRFDQHFRMSEADVAEYARERLPGLFGDGEPVVTEIGDGNINYVFRVQSRKTGVSVVIKHADTGTRSGSRILGFDRNRIEAELLRLEGELAPSLVPKVHDYDPVMACLIMEDLRDHAILRYELIAHRRFPRLAEDLSEFMVNTVVPTLDMVIDPVEKKALVKKYINPPLCAITEQLVYTEPYTNQAGRTKVYAPNAGFVSRELFTDRELHLEVARLKYAFMNDAQALIHGDLHTGSVFVTANSTKVIDPEFAYFGPIGYDLGNVVGNFCFARANAQATMVDPDERKDYIAWIDGTIESTVDLFRTKFLVRFKDAVKDAMGSTPGYAEWFLGTVIADSAGVAGLEIIRRLVGVAPVKDITGISDPEARTKAERSLILAAKDLIKRRSAYMRGRDFTRTVAGFADPAARQ